VLGINPRTAGLCAALVLTAIITSATSAHAAANASQITRAQPTPAAATIAAPTRERSSSPIT